jgi:hypothetical protein
MYAELFEAAVIFRQEQLGHAAEADGVDEHTELMLRAHAALQLIDALLTGAIQIASDALRTPENFQALLNNALYWISFRTNTSDDLARTEENASLRKLLSADLTHPEAYLDILKPWAPTTDGFDVTQQSLRAELRASLVDLLAPRVAQQALQLFEIDGGIRRLSEHNRLMSFKYMLLDSKSTLYSEPFRTAYLSMFEQAGENPVVHQNCIQFFELVLRALGYALGDIYIQDFSKAPSDHPFVQKLWSSVVARPLQYRTQSHILEGREKLISAGVLEDLLPIPDWLAGRLSEMRG